MGKLLLVLATSALTGLVMVAPAGAADLRVKARPLPPPVPRCAQFGGFYIGGNIGAGFYNHSVHDRDNFQRELDDAFFGERIHAHESGFIGGVQGGYNWQWNCTMVGIETDYTWARITASAFNSNGLDALGISSQLRAIGTIRARTGVVFDNVLLYVTGGLAYANFARNVTGLDIDGGRIDVFESSGTRWGWVVGFGAEWAIWSGNWSIKAEALYHRFDSDEQTFACVANCPVNPGQPFRFAFQDSVWTTKIGLNYRFNWGLASY